MADGSGLNGNGHDLSIECGELFARVAKQIQLQSDRSVRHLAPDTPCIRAGNIVLNVEPPSAHDPREKQRIGIIGDDKKITFVAVAFAKSQSETPKVKDSDSAIIVLRELANELHL